MSPGWYVAGGYFLRCDGKELGGKVARTDPRSGTILSRWAQWCCQDLRTRTGYQQALKRWKAYYYRITLPLPHTIFLQNGVGGVVSTKGTYYRCLFLWITQLYGSKYGRSLWIIMWIICG